MSRKITKALNREWEERVSAIPDDLEASAQKHNALQRHRGLQTASDLLRVIFWQHNSRLVSCSQMPRPEKDWTSCSCRPVIWSSATATMDSGGISWWHWKPWPTSKSDDLQIYQIVAVYDQIAHTHDIVPGDIQVTPFERSGQMVCGLSDNLQRMDNGQLFFFVGQVIFKVQIRDDLLCFFGVVDDVPQIVAVKPLAFQRQVSAARSRAFLRRCGRNRWCAGQRLRGRASGSIGCDGGDWAAELRRPGIVSGAGTCVWMRYPPATDRSRQSQKHAGLL